MKRLNAPITVETTINEPIEKVWKLWTIPFDISQWNNFSDDWHSPRVEIDLKEGGSFLYRMETKNGSSGFDHSGEFDKIIIHELIEYTGLDGRKSIIKFVPDDNKTTIIESFEPETETPLDIQKDFCQAILNNFKQYAENKKQP